MKKVMLLALIAFLTAAVAGCQLFIISSTTSPLTVPVTTETTVTSTTVSTGTTATTTATLTIDMEEVVSRLYDRIYQELYEDVRAEVLADLTEERFALIYSQVVEHVSDLLESGELTISSETMTQQILDVALVSSQAVVGVSNLDSSGNTQSIGSGIIYKRTADTYFVVTNHHVVENGSSFEVEWEDGTTADAVLRGVDPLVDIAVLYFTSTEDLPVATFGDSDLTTKGTVVLAVGHPSGYEFFNSTTMGVVSGIDRYFDIDNDDVRDMFVDYVQHDASINSGNSGGALFNLRGEVIGINVIKIAATEIEGMGFAIPINLAAAICSDIEQYGVSKQKPVLGITFRDIATTAPYVFTDDGIILPVGINNGFYIISVLAGSTMAGILEPGDILLEIGGVVIEDTDQFVAEFSQYRVGDLVDIVYYRGSQTYTQTGIELKPRP